MFFIYSHVTPHKKTACLAEAEKFALGWLVLFYDARLITVYAPRLFALGNGIQVAQAVGKDRQ